ncbi:MAG: 30S ribosomal protein S15 [Bdellovibrionaceae bacterium]|nr:30S ribosomal protein S15 [Pseudobdellovibrionaceae bacterium]|tara:strand:+ start:144 stop:413 length:270 start_codon:yes stop_codon:yes gene_type:complete
MALSTEEKAKILSDFKINELDTGSSQVQIALLTTRITQLTEHFKVHKKDAHSQRGLVKLVNRRRKLLDYLKRTQPSEYTKMLSSLGIRK